MILLEKDLDVLADGVVEGRRIFANTIKYVLMGTSSNFGNMFSAAGASLFLPFLPMLPCQILLNNLLYDTSQLAIPTDNVDEEQLRRPSHWDIGFIRRFMIFFGPLSSLFDFATFGVMLWVFHAGAARVPHRLVRRVARHPDPGDLRDPHPAQSRSSAATPACRSRWPRSASSRSARCCPPPRWPTRSASARCPALSSRRSPAWSSATWPDRVRQALVLPHRPSGGVTPPAIPCPRVTLTARRRRAARPRPSTAAGPVRPDGPGGRGSP